MTEGVIRTAFERLISEKRWCAWKSKDHNGKPTKLPVCRSGMAKSNDPSTWMAFEPALSLAGRDHMAGLGVFLGRLIEDSGVCLIGFDLDTCRDPDTGRLEDWAREVVDAVGSYTEISPSGTGLKVFALASMTDLDCFKGVLNENYSKQWTKRGAPGGHPPCVDLYVLGRFFTVTGNLLDGAADRVGVVSRDALSKVIIELGPKLAGSSLSARSNRPLKKATRTLHKSELGDEDNFTPLMKMRRWASSGDFPLFRNAQLFLQTGDSEDLKDKTRSGQEFRFAYLAQRTELSKEQYLEAASEWTNEGFGYGTAGGDHRRERVRARALELCWEKNKGSQLPIYQLDDERNGLYVFHESRGQYEWLCGYINPIKELIDENDEFARQFEIKTRFEETKTIVLPCRTWVGRNDDFMGLLASAGLKIATHGNARNDLRPWLESGKPPHAKLVSKTGWFDDDIFVLPENVIARDKHDEVIDSFADDCGYRRKGTLKGWQSEVAALCEGNSRLILAVCAALLGVLLKPLEIESGGIHLTGPSSIGKSTALLGGASVFGTPQLVGSWRATDNGLEGLAAKRSDTILILDELAEVNPTAAAKIVYMLANGQGKSRANRDGTLRTSTKWRVFILSSGEIALKDKLSESSTRTTAGQETRLLNVAADAGAGLGLFEDIHGFSSASAFAEALKSRTARYYGHAGPEFVRRFLENKDSCMESFICHSQDFLKQAENENHHGQLRRALNRFAGLEAAGELAIELGVLPWPKGEAKRAMLKLYSSWLDGRGHSGSKEAFDHIEVMRQALETHGEEKFRSIDMNDGTFGPQRDRWGYRRKNTKTSDTEYLVLSEAWKRIYAGHDPVTAAKTLRDHGYLAPGDGNHLQQRVNLAPHGLSRTSRAYVVKASIFDGDIDDFCE